MSTAILVIGILAATFLIIAYGSQSLHTIKTRDTAGINPLMFGIVWFACLSFVITGILIMVNLINQKQVLDGIANGLPIALSNLIVGAFCTIVSLIKFNNMRHAKARNMSENDYYTKHVLPKLKNRH